MCPQLTFCVPTSHDDLKAMLDTNKDSLKLEAMKRIVAVRGVRGDPLGEELADPRALLGCLWTFPQ